MHKLVLLPESWNDIIIRNHSFDKHKKTGIKDFEHLSLRDEAETQYAVIL